METEQLEQINKLAETIKTWNLNIDSETSVKIVEEIMPSIVQMVYFWRIMDAIEMVIVFGIIATIVCFICKIGLKIENG